MRMYEWGEVDWLGVEERQRKKEAILREGGRDWSSYGRLERGRGLSHFIRRVFNEISYL